jgi:hypothetical protein
MGDFHPDKIGYYGRPVSSLTKDELLKAVVELSKIIYNCPERGKCKEVIEPIEQE